MGLFRKKSDLSAIMRDLQQAPHGPERLALAEQGIAAALLEENEAAGFVCREELLLNCCLLGRLEKAIPALEWCLSRCDRDPGLFDIKRVLFQYKWIVEELSRHVRYDADTIERGMADLERRFDAAGWNRRGPLELRMLVAWSMRRPEEAAALYPEWNALPRDEGSDCAACGTAHRVRHLINEREMDAAVEAAATLISGDEECMEEPAKCFSRLQFALMETGRVEEAMDVHARSLEAVAAGPMFADARANHMMFSMLVGEFERAGAILEISLPQALDSGVDRAVLETCEMGALVLDVLRRRRLDMPSLEPAPSLGIRDAGEWMDWMAARSRELGDAFDARNGNHAWTDGRAGLADLAEQFGDADL